MGVLKLLEETLNEESRFWVYDNAIANDKFARIFGFRLPNRQRQADRLLVGLQVRAE